MSMTTQEPRPFEVRRGATPHGGPLTLRGQHWPAPPGAPTALLLPGGGQTHASWHRTARSLTAAGLGALLVDLRGHGSSDWAPDGAYGVDAFVEDLLAVCATPDRPPVVVGASLGGLVALMTVGEHPGCASGLVMVDIAIDNREAGVGRIRDFLSGSRTGFDTLTEFADVVAGYTGAPAAPADRMRRHARRGADGRWYWHWDPRFMDHHPDFAAARDRLVTAAARVRVPTLLVRGQQSDVVSEQDVESLRALLPQAEHLDVAGAGHMVTGDDNDVFAGGLVDFVRRTR